MTSGDRKCCDTPSDEPHWDICIVGYLDELMAIDSVLSLLHYRGIVDSEWNREDVKNAQEIARRLSVKAERLR